MPAGAHNRVIVYGKLLQAESSAGVEQFQFGWADDSALSPSVLANDLVTPIAANWQLSGIDIMACAQYVGVRVEAIDAAGKVSSSYNAVSGSTPIGLNSATNCALLSQAITLETGQRDSKGTLIRGRFYPPAIASGVTGASVTDAQTNAYIAAWATFMSAMVTAGSVVAVASSTSVGLVTVTGLSCDNIVDTQRRRKNALVATRASHAL